VSPLTRDQLEAALDHLRASPADSGGLRLIVRRPEVGHREVLDEAVLDLEVGLVGDNWLTRGSTSTADGSAHPNKQITVMNARCAELVAGGVERMALAGDQLYVDYDLSVDNVPAGTRLQVGEAVLEMSPEPHRGCAKFVARFGAEAMQFVNSRAGRALRLRGANTRVVEPGVIRVGDVVTKA
jgi:MOSC domain-containing protein YiiM